MRLSGRTAPLQKASMSIRTGYLPDHDFGRLGVICWRSLNTRASLSDRCVCVGTLVRAPTFEQPSQPFVCLGLQ